MSIGRHSLHRISAAGDRAMLWPLRLNPSPSRVRRGAGFLRLFAIGLTATGLGGLAWGQSPTTPAPQVDIDEEDGVPEESVELTPAWGTDLARRLESPRFEDRVAATKQLRTGGSAAVPVLESIARTGSRESADRVMSLLETAYQSSSGEMRDAVEAALTRLTTQGGAAVSARATRILTPAGTGKEDFTQIRVLGGGMVIVNNQGLIQKVGAPAFRLPALQMPPQFAPPIDFGTRLDRPVVTTRLSGAALTIESESAGRNTYVTHTGDGKTQVRVEETRLGETKTTEEYGVDSLDALRQKDSAVHDLLTEQLDAAKLALRLPASRSDLPATISVEELPGVISWKSTLKTLDAQLANVRKAAATDHDKRALFGKLAGNREYVRQKLLAQGVKVAPLTPLQPPRAARSFRRTSLRPRRHRRSQRPSPASRRLRPGPDGTDSLLVAVRGIPCGGSFALLLRNPSTAITSRW